MKVTIAFDADPSRIGKTVEVDDAEARVMIREGRARPADTKTTTKTASKSDSADK